MKIIGKTSQGFIIEAKEHEISSMNGFRSIYSDGWKTMKGRDGIKEGFSFDVEALAKKVNLIKDNQHKVKEAICTFRNLADALEMAWPAFEKLNEDME